MWAQIQFMQKIKNSLNLLFHIFQEFGVFEEEQGTVKEAFSFLVLISASQMAMIGNAYYGIV